MKVILLENVKKVGKKDEVVEVSLGYGKNFLIKNNHAIEATDSNMKRLKTKLLENQKLRDEEIEKAKKLKKQLESKVFEFKMNLGNNGNVFGKISTKQIATKLKQEGFEVDRKKIKTEGVNHLGEEKIDVELDKEVVATIKINIKGE